MRRVRLDADVRSKCNVIRAVTVQVHIPSYIRECVRVNKIFFDEEKGSDL